VDSAIGEQAAFWVWPSGGRPSRARPSAGT
jgi:hypothetical protein